MKDYIDITADEFENKFSPISNHLNGDESTNYFETFGEELEFVKSQPINKVWTITESEDKLYIANGFRIVDRFAYLVTEEEWKDGDEYAILYYDESELNEDEGE